jgi:tellurite resistance protein TerC
MIVFPGPAFIVIPIGLSILATEFIWARKVMEKFKEKFSELTKKKN